MPAAIQLEGQWEEVARHADQFRGRRVRVTVLADAPADVAPRDPDHIFTAEELEELRREGKAMQAKRLAESPAKPEEPLTPEQVEFKRRAAAWLAEVDALVPDPPTRRKPGPFDDGGTGREVPQTGLGPTRLLTALVPQIRSCQC